MQIIRNFYMRTRGDRHGDRASMKTPVVLVATALTVAILVAASFVIVTETRGAGAERPPVYDHLWKMKNAPAAMKPKPSA